MIDGEIKRYIRDNSEIRIPRSTKELSYKIINYKGVISAANSSKSIIPFLFLSSLI